MPDYQKAKIYKLWSPQGTEDEIYFGSTTDELRFRKSNHKRKTNPCQSKILFEKYNDVRIEVIEEYPCNSKAELLKKEGEYIRNNKCLNRNIPDRKMKEYYKEYVENNKEKIKENRKNYYENNRKKINDYFNQKITCECGCLICKGNIIRHQKTQKHKELMEKINNNI